MEGSKDMTSNTSNNTTIASNPNNSTAAASAPHNHQQDTNTKKAQVPQQNTTLCCPRCFSTNTKFCYYNNYNLNQPRYFCKDCRRYWTQGGSLRLVPVGGGYRRSKQRAADASSSATSTAATSAEVQITVAALMITEAATMSVSSPATGQNPNGMLPTFTPTGSSGVVPDVAMDEQQQGFLPIAPLSSLPDDDQAPMELAPGGSEMAQPFTMDEQQSFLPLSDDRAPELAPGGNDMGFLPFAPMSLFDDQASEEMASFGGSEMAPTFMDMMTGGGGYFDVGGGSSSYGYDGGFAMSSGINGMDMSFLLPEATDDPMQTQLMEGINYDVPGEFQWASSELDNYFNDDGDYAPEPPVGVQQQQQIVGDEQQDEDNNKAQGSSKNNNDDGGSSVYSYWPFNTTNNSDGTEG